jgi:ferrous iron transport protein B
MIQAVVGMVTITLFVPCIASLMMIIKEQGMKVAALMLAMIIPTAFLIGGLLNPAAGAAATADDGDSCR